MKLREKETRRWNIREKDETTLIAVNMLWSFAIRCEHNQWISVVNVRTRCGQTLAAFSTGQRTLQVRKRWMDVNEAKTWSTTSSPFPLEVHLR
jgi:hypothetical protein